MKNVLILGANGYLGSRLFNDLRKDFQAVGTYHSSQSKSDFIQLDITNSSDVMTIFNDVNPDVVIHTANNGSGSWCENHPEEAKKLNQDATQVILTAADAIKAKVIYISSFAALNPDNIYGKTKKESENIVKQAKSGYLILRPSLILGLSPNTENDRPFNRVIKLLKEKTSGEFDTSWHFQPTYIGHISGVIKTCLKKNIFNKTVHVFCDSVQTQYSTARDILEPFRVAIKPIDKHMSVPLQKVEESELTDLNLPTCRYEDMIHTIHQEIANQLALLRNKG